MSLEGLTSRGTPRIKHVFSPQERAEGFVALVYANGDPNKAHFALANKGIDIPKSTLHDWRYRRKEEYEAIRREMAPEMKTLMDDGFKSLINLNLEVAHEATLAIQESLRSGQMKDRERIDAGYKASLNAAIAVDKSRLINEEATQIVSRTLPEIKRSLEARGARFIENAAEVIDETVVESD